MSQMTPGFIQRGFSNRASRGLISITLATRGLTLS